MVTGAAVVRRWPPEQQICREFIEVVEEVMNPDKLSAGSGSGWMGGAEELPEIKQRRVVYELSSSKESVIGKMLAIETMSLCAPYLQYNKPSTTTAVELVIKCTSQYAVKHVSHII